MIADTWLQFIIRQMVHVSRATLVACILVLLYGCRTGALPLSETPTSSSTGSALSAATEPVPFEICGESTTWMRPSEMEQESKWWNFGRYAGGKESIIKYPWTHNFFVFYGYASIEYDLVNLSGLWTLPPNVRKNCMEPDRHEAIVRLERAEVWALFHRVKSISRVGADFIIIVEPVDKGVQFIQLARPDRQIPLTFHFKTEDGREIEKIVEAESFYWSYPHLKPTREP